MTDTPIVHDRRLEDRGIPDRRKHARDVFVEFRDVYKAYGTKQVLRGANLKVFRRTGENVAGERESAAWAKEAEDRRLTMTASQQNLIVLSTLFGIPAIVLLTGVLSWWRRR